MARNPVTDFTWWTRFFFFALKTGKDFSGKNPGKFPECSVCLVIYLRAYIFRPYSPPSAFRARKRRPLLISRRFFPRLLAATHRPHSYNVVVVVAKWCKKIKLLCPPHPGLQALLLRFSFVVNTKLMSSYYSKMFDTTRKRRAKLSRSYGTVSTDRQRCGTRFKYPE